MPQNPEIPTQTSHEKILVDTVKALPTDSRVDVVLQLQDEVVENPATQALSPIDSKRAEAVLGAIIAWAKGEELPRNRQIAGSLNLTEQDLRAVEKFASLTQGNSAYRDFVLPDGSVISNRRYRDILAIRKNELENPQARIEWGKWIKRELRRLGPEAIRDLQQRIEDFRLIGFMPPLDVISMGVRLTMAEEDLASLARNGGVAAPSSLEQLALIDQWISEGKMDPQAAFQRMASGTPAGRTMMTEYQRAFDRFREAYLSFEGQPEMQESIVYGLVAGQIIGGSSAILPNFYSNAFKQIGRESSKHSMFFEALQFVIKAGGIGGYVPMDAMFQALGSTSQEVLGFMDDAKSIHELWVEPSELPKRLRNDPEYANNPDKPLKFRLSAREMLGVYGTAEMMAKLGINTAKDIQVFVDEMRTKEGFWSVRNNAFGRYIFHKMGYSEQEIEHMFETKEFPKLRRAGDLSKVTGNEITDFWDWVGEVALDKMIIALTWIQYSRWDVEAAPLDLKRRKILSMRGVFLAAYRLGYGIGLPPEQFRNMIALFGSIPSIDRKAMIAQIQRDLRAHDDQTEVMNKAWKKAVDDKDQTKVDDLAEKLQYANLRQKILEETTKLERPILSASRLFSRMAMGIGEFSTEDSVEYRRRVRSRINKIDSSAGVEALRLPELWKYKWFENVEGVDQRGDRVVKDISEWRFVSNNICQTEDQMRNAFMGIDFSIQLEDCGLRPDEIEGMAYTGYDGWKNFLKYANLGVLHWSEEGYTTGDKGIRYLQKVDASGDVTNHFMEVSSPMMPSPLAEFVETSNEFGLRSDLPARRVKTTTPKVSMTGIPIERQESNAASSATHLIRDVLQKVVEPFGGALSYVSNPAQSRFLESTLNVFIDGHFAHSLGAYVERVVAKSLAGGDHFQVHLLYENPNPDVTENVYDTKNRIFIPKWRMDVLKGEGFSSIVDPDDREGKLEIISPIAAPLPQLITAGQLLTELYTYSEEKIRARKDVNRYKFVSAACDYMKRKGAFCWDTLSSNRTDISPGSLDNALKTMKEEGPLTGATMSAIRAEILSFIQTDHPGSFDRQAKFGGNRRRDEVSFLIPRLLK